VSMPVDCCCLVSFLVVLRIEPTALDYWATYPQPWTSEFETINVEHRIADDLKGSFLLCRECLDPVSMLFHALFPLRGSILRAAFVFYNSLQVSHIRRTAIWYFRYILLCRYTFKLT
jgi:hypothetical protein